MLIGTFAKRVGLTKDTLRYYEKIGLMPEVNRMPSGRRQYTSDHIAWVDFLNILKATGMGVSDMSQYVDLRSKGIDTLEHRQNMLVEHLEKVTAKRKELEAMESVLTEKIGLFQSVLEGKFSGEALSCDKGAGQ